MSVSGLKKKIPNYDQPMQRNEQLHTLGEKKKRVVTGINFKIIHELLVNIFRLHNGKYVNI